MFGHKSDPAIVYRFGCRLSPESESIVWQMLRAGHRYRNKLVELELARRAAVEALVARLEPRLSAIDEELAAIEKQVEVKLAEIRAARQRVRSRQAA
jgi:hypothetical protein